MFFDQLFVIDRRQTESYIQFCDAAMFSFYTPQNLDIKEIDTFRTPLPHKVSRTYPKCR
jgi:hypothetical protein